MAFTSIIMKVFERLLLNLLKTKTLEKTDSSQFAYQANLCVEDAMSLMLHNILVHIKKHEKLCSGFIHRL